MEIGDFPYCCKAFILYNFPSDKHKTPQWGNIDEPYKYWTEQEIEDRISIDLTHYLESNNEHEEYMYIAAISRAQMIAKKVFEDAGFKQFGTTVNEGSYDGEVWYYSKLVQNDVWGEEEEDPYYDDDEYVEDEDE
jgi:hypothetical protein